MKMLYLLLLCSCSAIAGIKGEMIGEKVDLQLLLEPRGEGNYVVKLKNTGRSMKVVSSRAHARSSKTVDLNGKQIAGEVSVVFRRDLHTLDHLILKAGEIADFGEISVAAGQTIDLTYGLVNDLKGEYKSFKVRISLPVKAGKE